MFEAAFVIDDTDDAATPSRAAIPASTDKDARPADSGKNHEKAGAEAPVNGSADSPRNGDNGENSEAGQPARTGTEQTTKPASTTPPIAASELPPEVRIRLRKLEKLERTYPGSCRRCRAPPFFPLPAGAPTPSTADPAAF